MNAERSFVAPRTFPDAYIEHWAAVYLDPRNGLQLRARLVKFDTFLLAPERYLRRIERRVVVTSGLMPAQRAVQRRVDRQEQFVAMTESAVRAIKGAILCANGRVTEKLKHHAWPARRRLWRKPREI